MEKIILFVDCDNQSSAKLPLLHQSITASGLCVSLVFLAGNSNGSCVNQWRKACSEFFPCAIIDSVVSSIRKESADAYLIFKMGSLRNLFSDKKSTSVVIISADDQILSAAEIAAQESGMSFFFEHFHGQSLKTILPSFLQAHSAREAVASVSISSETKGKKITLQSIAENKNKSAKDASKEKSRIIKIGRLVFSKCHKRSIRNTPYILESDAFRTMKKLNVDRLDILDVLDSFNRVAAGNGVRLRLK